MSWRIEWKQERLLRELGDRLVRVQEEDVLESVGIFTTNGTDTHWPTFETGYGGWYWTGLRRHEHLGVRTLSMRASSKSGHRTSVAPTELDSLGLEVA